MGDNRRRLTAAFASLAIATTALGFITPPANAEQTTTTSSETTPATTSTESAAPAPTSQPSEPTTAAPEASPVQAPTQEPAAPVTEAAPEPAPVPLAPTKIQTEATAGGPTSTGQSILAQLPLAANTAPTTYDRALFNHWIDADGDGCDTRAEVLIEESAVPVTFSSGCTVATGEWISPYDGATWTNASDVDIDHMIPLAEAWRSSAWNWTAEQRTAFANDLGYVHSLVAATDNVNQSKGDQDPATWMPALNQCEYVTYWVTVKWRWNIAVDDAERSFLGTQLNGTECGTRPVVLPAKMIQSNPTTELWPLAKIVYDATIYELVMNQDGSQTPVPLSYEKWRDVYKFKYATPAPTDFVKYPWSPTVYAVTFWPGGENAWMWTRLSYQQWQTAKNPTPRIAGWIKGSHYYRWVSDFREIFVEGEDGVKHKLTLKEWEDSGRRSFEDRQSQGFYALRWAPELARMTNVYAQAGRPLGYAEWRDEDFPTPQPMQRIQGDQFYRDCNSSTVWYAGPGMNRPVTFQEWQAAGSPSPTVNGTCSPPPGNGGGGTQPPTQPSYPGDTKNCIDFPTQAAAQQWFNTYYPYYGDVAKLDNNNDGIACETRP